jgi:hypothetical protein
MEQPMTAAHIDDTPQTRVRRVPSLTPAQLSEGGDQAFTAMSRAGEAVTHGLAAYQRHMMDFTRRRLERDIETSRAFASCRTPADFAKLQAEFTQTMMQDYLTEWQALFSIGADMAKGVVAPLEASAVEAMQLAERRLNQD